MPLRVGGLMILINERRKSSLRQAYLGNLQWSILQRIHKANFKGSFDMESYGDFCERLNEIGKPHERPEDVKAQAVSAVTAMLQRHKGAET